MKHVLLAATPPHLCRCSSSLPKNAAGKRPREEQRVVSPTSWRWTTPVIPGTAYARDARSSKLD